jgi:hypothetical protein
MHRDAAGGTAMSHRTRAFAWVLTILLAVGCASTVLDQRVSWAQGAPVVVAVPLAGHPPVAASGTVATFDPATSILRFDDGRLVKLTGESKLVPPVASPIRAGDVVVLQDVLPVGVQSGVKTLAVGQPQRMGTIASVDEDRGLVGLTDGTVVSVTRSTNVHLGAAGSNVALTQVNPGDEVVVVLDDVKPAVTTATADAAAYPNALPRQDLSSPAVEAGEVMIFRVSRRP